MATFKVGQRVRVVSTMGTDRHMIGCEGRIAPHGDNPPPVGWYNVTFGIPNKNGYDSWERPGWEFGPHHLAPLTDPKADEFVERIKKLKPEPVVPLPSRIGTPAQVTPK